MTSAATLPALHRDTRGAVMLTGLGMSLALTGSMWFIVGTSKAILQRHGMQEATDHGAFTSAVMHAKGMNFIALTNIILLILFVIHIVMGLITDILFALCVSTLTTCLNYPQWRLKWGDYASVMKPVATAMHYLEQAAAIGYPFLAAYKAHSQGGGYAKQRYMDGASPAVWALSSSLVQGEGLMQPMCGAFGPLCTRPPPAEDDKTAAASEGHSPFKLKLFDDDVPSVKLGLPVQMNPMRHVCSKVGALGVDAFAGLTGRSMPEFLNGFLRGAMNGAQGAIAGRYCNAMSTATDRRNLRSLMDFQKQSQKEIEKTIKRKMKGLGFVIPDFVNPFKALLEDMIMKFVMQAVGGLIANGALDPGIDKWFKTEGPALPWMNGGNGSPWQHSWVLTQAKGMKNSAKSIVALAARKYGVKSDMEDRLYLGASEFFYHCKSDWTDDTCNASVGDENAGYSLKWRGRLRRLPLDGVEQIVPNLLSGFSFDFKIPLYDDLKIETSEGIGDVIPTEYLSTIVDDIFKFSMKEFVEQPIQHKLLGELPVKADPHFGGALH